jgi:CheY-specific phosphatase CheX
LIEVKVSYLGSFDERKFFRMNVCVLTPPETYQQLAKSVEHGILQTFSALFDDVALCGEDYQNGAGFDGVAGLISFVGKVSWTLAIGFPRSTALEMAQKFAGCEIPFESLDMIDVVGELLNIVAGPTSAHLVAQGFEAKMGLPSVVRGGDIEVILPDHMAQRLHFTCKQGCFRAKIVAAQTE